MTPAKGRGAATNQSAEPMRIHREKVLAHAATRLAGIELPEPNEISKRLRRFLKIEDERLRMAHRRGATGLWTARARSFVLDVVVEHAFRAAAWPGEGGEFLAQAKNTCALIALGGYGRGEANIAIIVQDVPHVQVYLSIHADDS